MPCRAQRAAPAGRLNHQDRLAQAAYNPVTAREIVRQRPPGQGEFGHQGAAFTDPVCQFRIGLRIDAIQPVAQHRHGPALLLQRSPVRFRIYPPGQAAGHRNPLPCQFPGKIAGVPASVHGRFSTPDQGNLATPQHFRVTAYEQAWRRRRYLFQYSRVMWTVKRDQVVIRTFQAPQCAFNFFRVRFSQHLEDGPRQVVTVDCPGPGCIQHGLCSPEVPQQLRQVMLSRSRGMQQRQPGICLGMF